MKLTIKAIGDTWELDIVGIPYGSPEDKDTDGQYFSNRTKLHEDKFSLPPAVYYHGWDVDGRMKGQPEYIGKTVSYEDKPDGRHYRVLLDKANEYARRIWDAAKKGLAEASSGSVAHLVRIARDGHIDEWPVAEMSLIDVDGGKTAKNRHAVAIPVLKAMYERAGITLPDNVTHEDENEQQANGIGADAQGDGNGNSSAHEQIT